MSQYKDVAVGSTVYFWFAANTTAGAAGDGASPTFAVRLAGAASNAAPTATGTPTLLSHASYSDGTHEIAIDTTGYAAGEYAVFCSLTISSVAPSGFVGSFVVRAAASTLYEKAAQAVTDTTEILTRVPDATAGASGGLVICGSNAATTLATLTITGATTLTGNVALADGLTISAPSTGNRPGLAITGNGTGAGITSTGGATGPGFLVTGGGNNAAADGFRAVAGGALADGVETDRVNVTGTMTLTGAVSLGSTLGITGVATLASLSITGQCDAGNLLVDGTSVFTGAVTTGAATLASLSVTGQLDAGNLLIDGTSVLTGTVTAGAATLASFSVTGQLDAGNVLVDGTTVLTGAVTTGAITASAVSVTGQLDAGNVLVDSTFAIVGAVTGASITLSGALQAATIVSTGTTTFSALTVTNALTAGSNVVPWNATWDTEVQSEVDDALVAQKLDHLVAVADADDVVNDSIIAKLASSAAVNADWSTFVNTTDSLQAVRDRGDAAWITATGFALATVCTELRLAELDAANLPTDVANVKTDTAAILIDTAVIGALGAGLTAIPWNASWNAEVQSECDDAITANAIIVSILADTNELQTDWVNGGRLDLLIDAIKVPTDKLAFTVANQVDANVQYVNDIQVTGDGEAGTEWGPA